GVPDIWVVQHANGPRRPCYHGGLPAATIPSQYCPDLANRDRPRPTRASAPPPGPRRVELPPALRTTRSRSRVGACRKASVPAPARGVVRWRPAIRPSYCQFLHHSLLEALAPDLVPAARIGAPASDRDRRQ